MAEAIPNGSDHRWQKWAVHAFVVSVGTGIDGWMGWLRGREEGCCVTLGWMDFAPEPPQAGLMKRQCNFASRFATSLHLYPSTGLISRFATGPYRPPLPRLPAGSRCGGTAGPGGTGWCYRRGSGSGPDCGTADVAREGSSGERRESQNRPRDPARDVGCHGC